MKQYISFLFCIFLSLFVFGQYNAPKGTLVQTFPDSQKEFRFSSKEFATMPNQSDCMVLTFQYMLKTSQNSTLLELQDKTYSQRLFKIEQTKGTLTVSRFLESIMSDTPLPYILYDKMFDNSEAALVAKQFTITIFLSAHFIWFEVVSNTGQTYSPVFFGINSTYEGLMDLLLSKDPNYEIILGSNNNPDGMISNCKVYVTTTSDLISNIQNNYSNQVDGKVIAPVIAAKANQNLTLIDSEGIVGSTTPEQEETNQKNISDIVLFPNPLRMDEKMFVGFTLTNPSNIKVEIVSIYGVVEKTFDLGHCPSGRVEGHVDLSGLITGNYFVRLVSNHEIAIREVINKEETITKKIVKE